MSQEPLFGVGRDKIAPSCMNGVLLTEEGAVWSPSPLHIASQLPWLLLRMVSMTLEINFPGVRKDCCGEGKARKTGIGQGLLLTDELTKLVMILQGS